MQLLAALAAIGLMGVPGTRHQANPRDQVSPAAYATLAAVPAVPAFVLGLAARTRDQQVVGNYAALGIGALVGLGYLAFTGFGRFMISADSGRDPGSFGLPNPLITTAAAFAAYHVGRGLGTAAQNAGVGAGAGELARAFRFTRQ